MIFWGFLFPVTAEQESRAIPLHPREGMGSGARRRSVSQLFAALCLPQPVRSVPHNSPMGVKGTEAGHQDLEGAHKGLWGKHEIGFPSDCEGKNSPYCENK